MSTIGHNGQARDAGWYATHRDMLSHEVVGAGQQVKPANPKLKFCFSRYEAWHWLIANAAFQERSFNNKGRLQTLQPGQVVGGRKFLAETWNWTEQTVREFLKRLRLELMITMETDAIRSNMTTSRPEANQNQTRTANRNQRRHNTSNIITICNYLNYQLSLDEEQPPQQPANNQQTTTEQPPNNQNLTLKQINKVKSPPIVPQGGTSEHPMPSNVKPLTSETLYGEAHQPESVWLDDHGRPQIANGFRMEWVKRYQEKGLTEDILDLDVISLNVQPNSRLPLRNKMDRHLSLQLRKTAAKPKTEYDQKCDEMAEAMRKLLAD